MTALDWLRSKAVEFDADTLVSEGETYNVRRFAFRGVLPFRMAQQIKREKAPLINEEFEHEYLRLGGQYRSEAGNCEYVRTVYERVGA